MKIVQPITTTHSVIQWLTPSEVRETDSLEMLRELDLRGSSIRAGVGATLLWIVPVVLATQIAPDITFPIKRFIYATIVYAGLFFLLHYLIPFAERFFPSSYRINSKGVSHSTTFIRWSDIKAYSIRPHHKYPQYNAVTILTAVGTLMRITLPQNEEQDAIAAYIHVHSPENTLSSNIPHSDPLTLSTAIGILSYASILLWASLASYLAVTLKMSFSYWLFLLCIALLGPGLFISLLFLMSFPWRIRLSFSILLNMVTVTESVFFIVIFALRSFQQ